MAPCFGEGGWEQLTRSVQRTLAPARARWRAVCLPMPEEEPVTSAVRPRRLRDGGSDLAKAANDMAVVCKDPLRSRPEQLGVLYTTAMQRAAAPVCAVKPGTTRGKKPKRWPVQIAVKRSWTADVIFRRQEAWVKRVDHGAKPGASMDHVLDFALSAMRHVPGCSCPARRSKSPKRSAITVTAIKVRLAARSTVYWSEQGASYSTSGPRQISAAIEP